MPAKPYFEDPLGRAVSVTVHLLRFPNRPSERCGAATRSKSGTGREAGPVFDPGPVPYSSICAPTSTTRFGGRPKNEVALRAFRDITENRRSRHSAIPRFLEAMSVSRPRK